LGDKVLLQSKASVFAIQESSCGKEAMEVTQRSWKKIAGKTTQYSSVREQKAASFYTDLSYKRTHIHKQTKHPNQPTKIQTNPRQSPWEKILPEYCQ